LKISYHESGLFIQDDFKIGRTFSLLTGGTIQQSQLDEPEPNFNSREFFRTPNSYGYFSLRYENNKLANVYLSAKYTGSMKAPHYAGYIDEDRL